VVHLVSPGRETLLTLQVELCRAVVLSFAAIATLALSGGGIARMLAIGFALQAAGYLAAPVVALIADRDLLSDIHRELLAG